jgi:adenosylhomocysteine nucleosidase
VDNAEFRQYVSRTFATAALDMESTAVAHVAYINRVPFIAFRSLSDLAGAGESPDQEEIFEQLASDNSALVVRAFLRLLP